jgi:hypothetical protein
MPPRIKIEIPKEVVDALKSWFLNVGKDAVEAAAESALGDVEKVTGKVHEGVQKARSKVKKKRGE